MTVPSLAAVLERCFGERGVAFASTESGPFVGMLPSGEQVLVDVVELPYCPDARQRMRVEGDAGASAPPGTFVVSSRGIVVAARNCGRWGIVVGDDPELDDESGEIVSFCVVAEVATPPPGGSEDDRAGIGTPRADPAPSIDPAEFAVAVDPSPPSPAPPATVETVGALEATPDVADVGGMEPRPAESVAIPAPPASDGGAATVAPAAIECEGASDRPTRRDAIPNDEVVSHVVLEKRIGGGGNGQVWKARVAGGVYKAVKIIRGLGRVDAAREFRALHEVKNRRHVNLVAIDGIYLKTAEGGVLDDAKVQLLSQNDQGTALPEDLDLVIVMELADRSLRDELDRRRAEGAVRDGIDPDELLGWLREAAAGLDFLKQHGIVHGDVKPGNLLLCSGAVKLGDFGVAEKGHGPTPSLVGTLPYMPPELFHDEAVSGQETRDPYALAVTYHELRSGALPFRIDPTSTVEDVFDAKRLPEVFGVGPHEQRVLERALAANPAKRFHACMSLVDELDRAIRADRLGRRWSRGTRIAAGVAVIGVCVGIALRSPRENEPNGATAQQLQTLSQAAKAAVWRGGIPALLEDVRSVPESPERNKLLRQLEWKKYVCGLEDLGTEDLGTTADVGEVARKLAEAPESIEPEWKSKAYEKLFEIGDQWKDRDREVSYQLAENTCKEIAKLDKQVFKTVLRQRLPSEGQRAFEWLCMDNFITYSPVYVIEHARKDSGASLEAAVEILDHIASVIEEVRRSARPAMGSHASFMAATTYDSLACGYVALDKRDDAKKMIDRANDIWNDIIAGGSNKLNPRDVSHFESRLEAHTEAIEKGTCCPSTPEVE